MILYGAQSIDEEDIRAVVEVLRSDWLTTGPKVAEFEQAFAQFVGAKEAVAVSSGTAALHTAMYALGIGPGDEVIVPPLTFAATANCVVFMGGTPVFADVDPETLLINPNEVEEKITRRTKAVIAVDYTGHPCDYDALKPIVQRNSLALVADACHSLGAKYKNRKVGSLADLNIFSFHPVKHITTGEGGMITTNDPSLAAGMRSFRNHGINADHHQRRQRGEWFYEIIDLGYNYRLTDFQCALGLSQLKKLPHFLKRRREIAEIYNLVLRDVDEISPLAVNNDIDHAYHLYVIRINFAKIGRQRKDIFQAFYQHGIIVNVHYIPVHLHPFYQKQFGTRYGLCPIAENAYEEIISLPIHSKLTNDDTYYIVDSIKEIMRE
jgi:perosamine synthetase